MPYFVTLLLLLAQAGKPFTTPLSPVELAKKQAVVETSMGSFVIELYGDKAPNHVGYFMKTAREGGYTGTLIHRVVKYGIIQGGDPLSRDASKAQLWGSGGMNALKGEINAEPMTAGAVGAALVPGKPESGGAQFFVCATDQATLQGQFTVFGRVVEGLDLVQKISAVNADANGRPAERVVIKSVTIRDTPPPVKPPFVDDTPAELAKNRLVLETTKGEIELTFMTDKAPETVRQVLRLAASGSYDGTPFHRVVPNFVIQGGSPGANEYAGDKRFMRDELSTRPHSRGTVGLSTRGRHTGDAQIFINLADNRTLDFEYTVIGEVEPVHMSIVDTIQEGTRMTRVRMVPESRTGR